MPLVHHELCFGCGRANLFGLLLELEQSAPGTVTGRCFIKQDHQGAERGVAHEGIVAAALSEAMSFACGPDAHAESFEVTLLAPAPVGAFLDLLAHRESPSTASATAAIDQLQVARASGTFRS